MTFSAFFEKHGCSSFEAIQCLQILAIMRGVTLASLFDSFDGSRFQPTERGGG